MIIIFMALRKYTAGVQCPWKSQYINYFLTKNNNINITELKSLQALDYYFLGCLLPFPSVFCCFSLLSFAYFLCICTFLTFSNYFSLSTFFLSFSFLFIQVWFSEYVYPSPYDLYVFAIFYLLLLYHHIYFTLLSQIFSFPCCFFNIQVSREYSTTSLSAVSCNRILVALNICIGKRYVFENLPMAPQSSLYE